MKKNIIKFLAIFLICACICTVVDTAYASKIGDYFRNAEAKDLDPVNIKNSIFTVLTYLGYAAAICVVLVTGIQFLTANSQKKAQLKEKLWLIILGVALLAGGLPLLQLVGKLLHDMRDPIISSL